MPTTGSILGGAFRLLRDQPLAVLTWGGLYLVLTVASGLATRSSSQAMLSNIGSTNPQAAVAAAGSMFGISLLLSLALLILFCVLAAAAYRAVLRPAEPGLAFLRFGIEELLIFVLSVLFVIGFYILLLVAVLIIALFAAMIGSAGGWGAGAAVATVLGLGVLGTFIYFAVRLSLAFPLVVLRRSLAIGESWRITAGRFWTLFGAYFTIFLLLMVAAILVGAYTAGPYIAALMRGGFDVANLQSAGQAQLAHQLGPIDLRMAIGWILNAAWGALSITLNGGAAATAVRELVMDGDEIAREFA